MRHVTKVPHQPTKPIFDLQRYTSLQSLFTLDLRLQDFMIDFMRSHPLDRISLTKGRSSTSESHPALNSLLRRLSNPTKFSFFGDIRGQAEVRKLLVHICIEKELPFLHFEVANEADARLRGEKPCRDK